MFASRTAGFAWRCRPEGRVPSCSARSLRACRPANGIFCRRPERRDYRRQVDLGARDDVVASRMARLTARRSCQRRPLPSSAARFPEGVPCFTVTTFSLAGAAGTWAASASKASTRALAGAKGPRQEPRRKPLGARRASAYGGW